MRSRSSNGCIACARSCSGSAPRTLSTRRAHLPVAARRRRAVAAARRRSGTRKEPHPAFNSSNPLRYSPSGKFERDRVVGRGAEALDDLRVAARVERGAGDDRLEQVGGTPPEQEKVASRPPGASSLSAQQVDVLVGARRVLHLRRGRRELRRVEHDEVELRVLVAQLAQVREDVGLDELAPSKHRAGWRPGSPSRPRARARSSRPR